MKDFRAVIFDMDGTLLDSMGMWIEVDRIFLAKRGIALPCDYSASIAPMGFPAAADYTKKRFSLPESREEIMDEWNRMSEEWYRTQAELKPYAREYLLSLHARGIPMAVATASGERFWRPALERCRVLSLFQSVTTVHEVTRGKGFPDIYFLAAKRLGVADSDASSCAVFEDIVAGIRGARSGGFFTVGVYDEYCSSAEEVRTEADFYIRSFAELL